MNENEITAARILASIKTDDLIAKMTIPAPFNTPDARAYLARCINAPLHAIANEVTALHACGDCDQVPSDYPLDLDNGAHTMLGELVLIGCEGVWQIESLRQP